MGETWQRQINRLCATIQAAGPQSDKGMNMVERDLGARAVHKTQVYCVCVCVSDPVHGSAPSRVESRK